MKQVTILAVVILLAVTITSAKRVPEDLRDETTTEQEPECYPDGTYYCGQASDCCGGLCKTYWFIGASYTVCETREPCRENRSECNNNNQCCSGLCKQFLLKHYCVEQTGSN